MGIRTTANIVNIFQTVLSTQFQKKTFIVLSSAIKAYSLGAFSVVTSDVVLLNGLFQIKGANNSYILDGTDIVFNVDTSLTVGDEIEVFFDGQI